MKIFILIYAGVWLLVVTSTLVVRRASGRRTGVLALSLPLAMAGLLAAGYCCFLAAAWRDSMISLVLTGQFIFASTLIDREFNLDIISYLLDAHDYTERAQREDVARKDWISALFVRISLGWCVAFWGLLLYVLVKLEV